VKMMNFKKLGMMLKILDVYISTIIQSFVNQNTENKKRGPIGPLSINKR
jgi:hypothetical protein